MPEEATEPRHMSDLPTEILLFIFTYLPVKDLIKSRQVCLKWRYIIDNLSNNEVFWWEHCRRDFKSLYQTCIKTHIMWSDLYKSLTLWPKLASANEEKDEFCYASHSDEEIIGFEILLDNIITVHRKSSVKHYNLDTLHPTKEPEIPGNFFKYWETTDVEVALGFRNHLFIKRKILYSLTAKPETKIHDVQKFYVYNRKVYYCTLDNHIYMVDLQHKTLDSVLIERSEENILCFGHTDRLNILTYQGNIYSVNNKKLLLQTVDDINILKVLKKYNFVENMSWMLYYQWLAFHSLPIPLGPLREITYMKVYNNIVFVGTNSGVLRIYNSSNMDLDDRELIKQFNFMERQDCPVLSDTSPILKIDVIEIEFGHFVVVAMPKKIALVKFTHDFVLPASVALLPYKETEVIRKLLSN